MTQPSKSPNPAKSGDTSGGRLVDVRVGPIPAFVELDRLLGPEAWSTADGFATARLDSRSAADLAARLRGVGLDGKLVEVSVEPKLPRPWVRDARTEDARRRRDTSPGFTRPGTQTDDEGRMSLTPEALAHRLGKLAQGASVVDAGCGVGGNAIGFARAGCTVTAIEQSDARCRMAAHNARVYGVSERITFRKGDAIELLPTLRGGLLFLDPPWGAEWNRERTSIDDFPLLRAALEMAPGRFEALWAKVPPSFDVRSVPGAAADAWFGVAAGDRQRVKFVRIVVRFTP